MAEKFRLCGFWYAKFSVAPYLHPKNCKFYLALSYAY
ncbi:hypothetical protein DESACE_06145 [Desulfurella acetivorans A63]|nr:hypothetical protein DESACE_06145 [Desulfurella acetivorans A63]